MSSKKTRCVPTYNDIVCSRGHLVRNVYIYVAWTDDDGGDGGDDDDDDDDDDDEYQQIQSKQRWSYVFCCQLANNDRKWNGSG